MSVRSISAFFPQTVITRFYKRTGDFGVVDDKCYATINIKLWSILDINKSLLKKRQLKYNKCFGCVTHARNKKQVYFDMVLSI